MQGKRKNGSLFGQTPLQNRGLEPMEYFLSKGKCSLAQETNKMLRSSTILEKNRLRQSVHLFLSFPSSGKRPCSEKQYTLLLTQTLEQTSKLFKDRFPDLDTRKFLLWIEKMGTARQYHDNKRKKHRKQRAPPAGETEGPTNL